MKIMRTLALLSLAGILSLASCESSFSGTDIKGVSVSIDALNSANRTNVGFDSGDITIPNTLTNAATAQTLIISFVQKVDEDSIIPAFSFFNLTNVDLADGAPTRGTANTFTVNELRYNSGTSEWDVYLSFANLSGASDIIEVFIDPTTLTANNGTLKLDEDGDNVQGEDNDDDVHIYLTGTGGTAASASQRDPRAGFDFGWTVQANTVGITAWTGNYGEFAIDDTDYKTLFDSIARLEKFDYNDGSWDNVAYTSVYTPADGNYVITFPAFAAGETYRMRHINLQDKQSTKTISGYNQKFVLDSTTTIVDSTVTVADTNQVLLADADVDVSTSFFGGKNGYIQIDMDSATIGAEGLQEDTVIAANLKILRSDGVYIPIDSIVVQRQDPAITDKNNQIILNLNPAYATTSQTFSVLFGPGMRMRGDLANDTSDDRHFGSLGAITSKPYGFLTLDSDTTTL